MNLTQGLTKKDNDMMNRRIARKDSAGYRSPGIIRKMGRSESIREEVRDDEKMGRDVEPLHPEGDEPDLKEWLAKKAPGHKKQ